KPETTLQVTPLPAREADDKPFWHGVTALELKNLPLDGVSDLRFNLEVADTLPAGLKGPQTARSREILVRIRRDAKPLMQQTFAAQAEELRQEMEKAKALVHDAKYNMQDKAPHLAKEDQIHPEALKQIEKSQQKAEEAA